MAECHKLLQTRPPSIWVHKSSLAALHPFQPSTLTELAGMSAASQGDVIPEKELRRLLSEVDLEYLVEREGGLDAVVDWGAQLSLGEQQRLGMARLFYHRPKFAILDECTSGVTVRLFDLSILPGCVHSAVTATCRLCKSEHDASDEHGDSICTIPASAGGQWPDVVADRWACCQPQSLRVRTGLVTQGIKIRPVSHCSDHLMDQVYLLYSMSSACLCDPLCMTGVL